tara:strand:- start:58 stop:471 length:414 start_codon:yes stop_codon:yes gene_type:complete
MNKITINNGVVVSRKNEIIGTFTYMDKYKDGEHALYFLDCFSNQWEQYDYSFNILTKKEIKEVISKFKDKIKLSTPMWVEFYSTLANYVEEYGSIDNRFDDDGNRKEEYEDEFCMIVDNVESIMEKFFVKADINEEV